MSDDLLQRTAAVIRQHRLFAPGQTILVAVSGGADSMVLRHLLHALAPQNRWQLAVIHFNHQLRGRASDADEQLVRRTGQTMGWPVYGGRADVQAAAGRAKISIEMAARQLRHAFFARVARRREYRTVALAHHAGDQVEHFFLRLLRGAGGSGLAGMAPLGPSPADSRITLVRPLLGVAKSDLVAYARAAGIAWREDASNRSSDPLRNRIRNELLPLLRNEYQSALDATVLRAMETIGAESKFVESVARQWHQPRRTRPAARKAGAGEPFGALPLAVQRKVIQRELIRRGLTPEFDLVETLRAREAAWISVSPGLAICRDAAGVLRLRRSNPLKFNRTRLAVKLAEPKGAVSFDGRMFQWRLGTARPFDRHAPRPALAERFDADKIGGQIILRHWRAGDRFQPIGMPVPVKLQDLFVNAKIPASLRRRLVLATTKTGVIFWVETFRIADPFKITLQTRRQLAWRQLGPIV